MRYALAALGLVALLAGAIWYGMRPSTATQQLPATPVIKAADVAVVQISMSGNTLRLHRENGTWLAGDGERANGAAVEGLLADFATMRPLRLLTRNSERYSELGLGEEAVRVTLTGSSGNVVADLYVGKQGADILSTYIRYAGMDAVLAVDRTLVWQVRRTREDWLAPDKPELAEEKELST